MSTFNPKTVCLVVIYLISSQTIRLTKCLRLKKEFHYEYNEHCFHWMQNLDSVNLIFCNVELEEGIAERSFGYKSTCITDINNKTIQSTTYKFCKNVIIFTDTRGNDITEECISKTIRMKQLTVLTKLIICDKSQEIPPHLKKEGSLKFLGSANALYITKSDCWNAGPFYLLRRTFSDTADCTGNFWVSDTELLPDMRGETVRAITMDRLLFSVIDRNTSDPIKRHDGIEVQIFLHVAKVLNFTWEIDEVAEEVSNKWGKLGEDGKWKGGVMEAITSGRADIMLAGFWLTASVDNLDYTNSWSSDTCSMFQLTLVFLVPRPTLLGSSWANLARPFQGSLWLSFGILVLTFPLMAWTMERLYMMYHLDHRHAFRLSGYLLYTAGSLTGGSCELATPRAPGPIRTIITAWYVVVMILYAGYTSNIASNLSVTSYERPLDTVRQLVEQNFSWGRTYWVDTPTKFLKMEDYWHRKFVQHYMTYNASQERALLLGRKFALYAQVLDGSDHILVDSAIDDDLVKGLRLMKEGLREYRVSTHVRVHSPLKHFYDRAITRLFENGFINYYKETALRKYQKSSYETFREDPDARLNTEPTVLALDDLKHIFYILLAGWLLSSVCFVLELYVHARSSSITK